jgi:hypothetical protein
MVYLLGHRGGGSIGLVVCAPVILVDRELAARRSPPRGASSARCGPFAARKVKAVCASQVSMGLCR